MFKQDLYTDPMGPVHDFKGTSDTENNVVDERSSTNSGISEQKTFLTAGLEDYYVPIDSYEGRHRFDTKFQWTEDEEKKLVRKVIGSKPLICCLIMTDCCLTRSIYVYAHGCALLSSLCSEWSTSYS
jgi:hypothetical protein